MYLSFPRDTPKDVQIAEAFNQATRISGFILALTSLTELVIANIIADYYSENLDKRNKMFYEISENLRLDQKRRTLMRILTETSFQNTMAHYPNLNHRLERLRDLRNRVAHSFPDTSDEFLAKRYSDRVRYVWYKNGQKDSIDLTYVDAESQIRECSRLFLDMEEIRRKIARFPSV